MYMKNIQLFILFLWSSTIRPTSSDGLTYRTNSTQNMVNMPDLYKRTPDFIEKNGYVAETHLITTEDGYIITMHRIPTGKFDYVNKNGVKRSVSKPVVIIQHGISGASDNWVLNGPRSLPFMLADAGFDVWLPDTRGNSYSKKHVNLTMQDPEFWDFSFHEQAYYDLPACIDYALRESNQSKLFYIGHSRGSTMALVLLSTRPEYNDKFHLVVMLAPVAYLKHSKSPLLKAVFENSSTKEIKRIVRAAKLFNLPGKTKSLQFRQFLCGNGAPTQYLCARALFLFNGFDYDLMNNTMLPVYISHFPDGGAIKEFIHYIQIAQSNQFQQYDYGKSENMRIYGQPYPPYYDFNRITAPMSLHYSDNDFFVSREDFDHLSHQLNTVIGKFRVPFKKFNHIDFIWGTKADVLVYKPIIKLMSNYL